VKFAGGLAYNNTLKQWEGTIFNPSENFVVKLSFRQATKSPLGRDRDEYDVTITNEGSSYAGRCEGPDHKPPFTDEFPFMKCSRSIITEYAFNFDNHRFISVYVGGYITGADNNNDTPAISGGLCTKISQ
jgi:hypothetical protein